MNLQSHFAKYLGKPIFNRVSEQEVILMGVREEYLQYQNGETFEELGFYYNFRIIVASTKEAIKMKLPDGIAVKKHGNTFKEINKLSPSSFLEEIKEIVYTMANLTDEIMWENRRRRLDKYRIPRQLIMSAYFCAFKEHDNFTITLRNAGDIYGLDHATVLHGIKTINNFLDTDKRFRLKYVQLWDKVKEVNKESDLHLP